MAVDDLEGYINFWPEFISDCKISEKDLCFIYQNKQLLLRRAEKLEVPTFSECKDFIEHQEELWYLGKWKGKPCYAYAINEEVQLSELEWVSFRDTRWSLEMELYQIAVKTQHLLNWDRSTRYCEISMEECKMKEPKDVQTVEMYNSLEFHQPLL